MKTAVIYARYSSDKQTEQSIEGQLHVCREYALKNDIVIVDTYIDRAMTGKNDRREDFQRMLRDSQKKLWDYVLVYKLDRFSRNKYETAIHKKTLRDNGIRLLSATENIPESPEGIILESLLEGMAEYYSAELAQKVRRGMHETRLKGNFCGGSILYGYRVENKKVLIDEERAPIVHRIYECYAAGLPVTTILDELNRQGVTYRGKPFALNTIYGILRNERYSGVFQIHGEIFTNTYPAIIEESLFQRVQDLIANNKSGRHSMIGNFLLRGKIKCGYCGSSVNGESGTSKNGKPCYYYKCASRKRKQPCRKKTVRKDDLESLVISVIEQLFSDKLLLAEYADRIIESYEAECRDTTVLNLLVQDLDAVETSIRNLLQAIEAGIITDSTKSRLQELEIQKADLQVKIEAEKSKNNIGLTRGDILEFFSDVLKLSSRQLIQLLIKEIILYDDHMEITFYHTKYGLPQDENRNLTIYEAEYPLPLDNDTHGKISEQSVHLHLQF